ncbi:ATP-binding cassette domain-containing protein [Deinococcus detaillensis]|uniref:ATP-binding cassette domain-containing protein n=1 Tax=Deinococcus detaillensis TaxID=2592048 RepID=A0A553USC7_9DEIO|nr:ATP-binding cassette domain-containing protein [Deinococcus detaillensis]TSA83114.1 ATP-binding cassette domain-containing protein [Deinococcus detaillensis]
MKRYALPLFLALLAALCAFGLTATGGALLVRASQHPETLLALGVLTTGVRAFGMGRSGLRYAERLLSHGAALTQAQVLRAQLYVRLAPLGRELPAQHGQGALLLRAGADVDALTFETLRADLPLWTYLCLATLLTLGLALLDPLSALLVGPLLLLAAYLPVRLSRQAAHLAGTRAELDGQHAGTLLALSSFGGELAPHVARARLAPIQTALTEVEARLAALPARLTFTREGLAVLALTLLMWRLGSLVQAGDLAAAWLAAAALGVVAAFDAAAVLSALPAARAEGLGAAERLAELQALRPSVTPPAHPASLPAQLALTLHDVVLFSGDPSRLTHSFPHGSATAIIGESGAGKTTLLRLLARDLDPASGQISVGGTPLTQLDPAAWRTQLSILDQDAALMDGTVAANLRLALPTASDAELRERLDELGLSHLNLDNWIGEGGAKLSGGERQRVALARALLRPSAVLILDEPTAHLDPVSEGLAVAAIQRRRAGRTLIFATHHTAPLSLADTLCRLHQGNLTELPHGL